MIIKNNIFNIKDEETYLLNEKNQKFKCVYEDGYTHIYALNSKYDIMQIVLAYNQTHSKLFVLDNYDYLYHENKSEC